jgi:Pvc16 N-terminal domain/Carboxypeptidase regulatory-like domain
VIRDLSVSLRNLLDDPALSVDFPELETAAVVFDRPTSTFNPPQSSVDLFLYDIRENVELRSNEREVVRNGPLATVRKAPMRIDCSYLVTAWPVGGTELPLQEHRLLSQTLQVLIRNPTLPAGFLTGSLIGQEPPLPSIAPEVDGLKSAAEFWTSMGSQLRAAFTVTVTISVPALPDVTGPIVTTKTAHFALATRPVDETRVQVGGQVVDGGGQGIAGAIVDVLDAGERAVTDAEGRYLLSRVPIGNRTLRVSAVGFQVATVVVPVPGTPDDYRVTLSPL